MVVVAGGLAYVLWPSEPDPDVLPFAQNTWCCSEGGGCYAGKNRSYFPPCVDIFHYGTLTWGLSGYRFNDEDAGKTINCANILPYILKVKPDALQYKRDLPEVPGYAVNTIYTCLLTAYYDEGGWERESAYVYTYTDAKDEEKKFRAYSSMYYCDESRAKMEKKDYVEGLSGCGELKAARHL